MKRSKSKELSKRHDADLKLREDASLVEANAWFVTNTMKAKCAIGAGLKKKLSYTKYPLNLDENERATILSASENKKPVEINANLFRTKASIMNETRLPLTRYRIKKIKKA